MLLDLLLILWLFWEGISSSDTQLNVEFKLSSILHRYWFIADEPCRQTPKMLPTDFDWRHIGWIKIENPYQIISRNHRRKANRIFVLCLSIADMIWILFCVPFQAFIYTFPTWRFGRILCKERSQNSSIFHPNFMTKDFLQIVQDVSFLLRTWFNSIGILVGCAISR